MKGDVSFPPQGSEASHFVLIAGEPIKEPVVQHGASFANPLMLPISYFKEELLYMFQKSLSL